MKIQGDNVAEVIRECPLPRQTSVHNYYSHRGGKVFRLPSERVASVGLEWGLGAS